MNEETLWSIDALRKVISNEPDYKLELILSDVGAKYSWGLFGLGSNNTYDKIFPDFHYSVNGVSSLYLFVFNDIADFQKTHCRCKEVAFFSKDKIAVEWALDLAGKWMPECEE